MSFLFTMKKIKSLFTLKNLPLLLLIVATIWLRLANLGYSDYQGDEIKALLRPDSGQSVSEFLYSQRKGPVQFLITYGLSFIDPTFLNQFLFRLPFALAGILSVYFFYKLLKMHFGDKVALYGSLFFSLNGILIAFSRIVQYQTVTIMFYLLALFFFSKTIKERGWKTKGWYFGMVAWALSILSHFDGGFIAPFVLYILYRWFKEVDLTLKEKLTPMFLSGILILLILGSFFVPYVANISESTRSYWLNRVADNSAKISSSIVTYKAYNPMYIFYAFVGLVAISFTKIKKTWPLLIWAIFPLFIWEVITDVPGTHIYNYLIPLFGLAAFGIVFVEDFIKRFFKKYACYISGFGLTVLFTFAFALSNQVFVDHSTEYPWEDESFMLRTMQKPNPIFHLSLFGFPYNRGWEEIKMYVAENNNGYYSTNERPSIPRFYIDLPKATADAGPYVSIVNPQSFADELLQSKARYWGSTYEPDKIIYRDGKIVARIYVMPAGDLDTIQEQGY